MVFITKCPPFSARPPLPQLWYPGISSTLPRANPRSARPQSQAPSQSHHRWPPPPALESGILFRDFAGKRGARPNQACHLRVDAFGTRRSTNVVAGRGSRKRGRHHLGGGISARHAFPCVLERPPNPAALRGCAQSVCQRHEGGRCWRTAVGSLSSLTFSGCLQHLAFPQHTHPPFPPTSFAAPSLGPVKETPMRSSQDVSACGTSTSDVGIMDGSH
jgi:hypothetical protein